VALRALQALAEQQPAVDAHGEVLHPLPAAHRQMTSPACLPHIAQVSLNSFTTVLWAAFGGHCFAVMQKAWQSWSVICLPASPTMAAFTCPLQWPPQVLLTSDPALVAGTATLLLTVLQHNAGECATILQP
jgi:hypothetical protein